MRDAFFTQYPTVLGETNISNQDFWHDFGKEKGRTILLSFRVIFTLSDVGRADLSLHPLYILTPMLMSPDR